MIAILLLLAQGFPMQTVAPIGRTSTSAITVQTNPASPLAVSGTFSSSGAVSTVGSTVAFNANNVCAVVNTDGNAGGGFYLAAGTLAGTLTSYYSFLPLASCAAGVTSCWKVSQFIDQDGTKSATLVLTNPNAVQQYGIELVGGVRQAQVCTTAFTSGTASGNLNATVTNVAASGGGGGGGGSVTQGTTPWVVSAASLPLPTGASTEATLAAIKAKTDNIDVALSTRTKPADTQAVSAASLPLPTGASTSALQTTGNSSLASIDTKLTNPLPVSATSLPLPSGASTSALQTTGNASLASIDTKLTNPLPVSGTVTAAQATGTNLHTVTDSGSVTNATLQAGASIVGKVGIDQTTPGTTNGVQINAAVPAGTNIMGKVGIDQTTPGTTNGVQVNAALPAGANILGKTGIDQTTPGVTNGVQVNAALPTGTNNIGNTAIPDGEFGVNLAKVLAPGQAPQAKDAALNVSLSPNSSIQVLNINAGKQQFATKAFGQMSAPLIVRQVDADGHTPQIKGPNSQATVYDQSIISQPSPIPTIVCPNNVPISQTASTRLVVGQPGKRIYICSILVVSTTAQSVSLTEGTGTVCGNAGATALTGSTTVANGVPLLAGYGWAKATDRPHKVTQVNGDDLCLLQSGAGLVAGEVDYAVY